MGHPERERSAPAEKGTAEGRLLAVLLVDALQVLGRGGRAPLKRQVQTWICDGTDGAPYSFERACELVGLPPLPLRRRLGLRMQVARRRTSASFTRGPRVR